MMAKECTGLVVVLSFCLVTVHSTAFLFYVECYSYGGTDDYLNYRILCTAIDLGITEFAADT
jgi:hypothetical protein